MINRHYITIAACVLLSSLGSIALGQDGSSADVIVTLNEGVLYYLQGQVDEDSLDLAVERLTSVIEREPGNTKALVFRALSYGRMGLAERRKKKSQEENAARFKEIRDCRADPERLDQIKQSIEEAEKLLASDSATEADKRVVRSMRDYHQLLLRYVEGTRESSDEDLSVQQRKAMAQAHVHAGLKRDYYLSMIADLRRLTQALEHPEAVIRLLNVVAHAKVARINEEEARRVVAGEIPRSEASGPVKALRQDAAARLSDAANILEALLAEELDQGTSIRAKFFLGVIRYRQGVPLGAEGEMQRIDTRGQDMLREAERLMRELADDETADRTWRSYAALYLGFILPSRAVAQTAPQDVDALLDEAERRLDEAAELDARVSDVRSTIPDLVWRHRRLIADLREKAQPAPPPRNDLRLSLYAGARRDTNVVLLGERTDLPRDISREKDFCFTAGTAIEYTWDFAEGLTLGVQGRVAELWNVDVDEFDQQTYGSSIALQYEAAAQRESTGPVYLAVQYDFDYTLLGRSAFLESHAITPSLRAYWAGRRAQTDLFFTYQIRDYFELVYDRRFNRDGRYLAVGVSQLLKAIEMTALYDKWGLEPWGLSDDDTLAQDDPDYPQRYLTPYIGASYAWDATAGDEFDRKAVSLSLGVGVPLPWGLQIDTSALLEWEEYPQNSLTDFHRSRRRDFVQEYGIALSRTFVLRPGNSINRYTPVIDRTLLTVRAFATWTLDDSNVVDRLGQAIFEYDRTVYGLSFAFTFN